MLSPAVSRLFGRPRIVTAGRGPRCGGIRRPNLPRRIPNLRRPIRRTLNMANGDMMLDASGNAVLSDASRCWGNSGDLLLSNGAGDACYCSTPTCGDCPSAPTTLTAIVVGTVLSPGICALDYTGSSGTVFTGASSFDGTFTLTRPGSSCNWIYSATVGSFAGSIYCNCSGPPVATGNTTLVIEAIYGATSSGHEWQVTVIVGGSGIGSGIGGWTTSWSSPLGCPSSPGSLSLPFAPDTYYGTCGNPHAYSGAGTISLSW